VAVLNVFLGKELLVCKISPSCSSGKRGSMFCKFTELIIVIAYDWPMTLTLLPYLIGGRVVWDSLWEASVASVYLRCLALHLEFRLLRKFEFYQVKVSRLV
jgi:hypothetical protein